MTSRRRPELVRSFVLTGGRAQPTGNFRCLDVLTMVTSVPGRPSTGLQPEHLAMVRLCRGGYLTVAEVAGHLGHPLTITRILLSDLLDSGHLITRSGRAGSTAPSPTTAETSGPTDIHILERMLHGLQAL